MYRKKKSSWLKHFDFFVLDIVTLQIAFVIAYMIRHGIQIPYVNHLYREMAVVFTVFDLLVAMFMESFKNVLRRGLFQEFKLTFYHVTWVMLCTCFFLFFVQAGEDYSRFTFVIMWAFYICIDYASRLIYKYAFLNKRAKTTANSRSLLVITSADHAEAAIRNIKENNYEDFYIKGVCVMDEDWTGREIMKIPVVANGTDLLEYACTEWIDEVFIVLPQSIEVSDVLLNHFIGMGITVHQKLAKYNNMKGQVQTVEKIAGYTVLTSSIIMASTRQLFFKRALDIVGGIVGCIITAILFIFVAPAIWMKSPGPVFFSQERVGKNGKKFKIYKFRSMYMDAEERKKELMAQNKMDGLMFKMDNDPRIIGGENGKGIGNFIRNTSIDEFPQFWNVLKGDMSLVGTRPPTVDEWEQYELHHRARLAARPGLTGMWQVSGRSDITDFEEVVKLDMEYITNWRFALDLRILVQTVGVVLGRKGSS